MTKLFYLFLVFILVVGCQNDNLESNIVEQKTEKIYIDSKEYEFIFYKDDLGEISIDKKGENLLDSYAKDHENLSFCFDDEGFLHLFENSKLMDEFMRNENKQKNSKFTKSVTPELIYGTNVYSLIEFYDGKDFSNLMFKSYLNLEGKLSNDYNWDNLYLGGMSYVGGSYNDKISSIRIKTRFPYPASWDVFNSQYSYCIFYRDSNYGGYSFGVSASIGNDVTIEYSNLHNLKMSGSLWWKKYWGNRISSFKHYN